jgi:hypothetical protein
MFALFIRCFLVSPEYTHSFPKKIGKSYLYSNYLFISFIILFFHSNLQLIYSNFGWFIIEEWRDFSFG